MRRFITKTFFTVLLFSLHACSSVFDSEPTESTIKESYLRDFEENIYRNNDIYIYRMEYWKFFCVSRGQCANNVNTVGQEELKAIADQFDKEECKTYTLQQSQPDAALCLISIKTPAEIIKRYEDVPKRQYFRVTLLKTGDQWDIGNMAKTDERSLPDNN